MREMEDNSVDLVLTDPPYNLNKDFENDNLSDEDFIDFLTPIFNELSRVIKNKHPVIIFFDSGQKLPLFWKALFNSTLYFQKSCNLYKPNDCSMPHNRTLRKSEVFYILSSTPQLHSEGDTYIHDCLIGNHEKKNKNWYHPTAKNLKITEQIVKSHSVKENTVLDPFMGSGTTAVACAKTGRNFIGFELEQKYVDIANKRVEPWLQQTSLTDYSTLEAVASS